MLRVEVDIQDVHVHLIDLLRILFFINNVSHIASIAPFFEIVKELKPYFHLKNMKVLTIWINLHIIKLNCEIFTCDHILLDLQVFLIVDFVESHDCSDHEEDSDEVNEVVPGERQSSMEFIV